jgi:predicted AlkP superfamily phosphohydrolase/phosphomutase
MKEKAHMDRLLIIGLDGATFDLIKPWVLEGKLPHLGKLLESGVHGALKSTIPPMSPPAWTSFMTGKNPGKHGVFDFTARKPYSYEIEFVNARWRKAATIWKIMSDAGKRVCVLGVPITYPPEKVNGIMISGIDTPATGGIADATAFHPPELHHEIATKLGGYLISPNLKAFADHQCEAMVEAALRTVERKMDTALYLLAKEPWDCFMITIGETDGITHRLWKYHDKLSPLSDEHSSQYQGPDPILSIYQRVDQYIGKLCAMESDNSSIMLMSDHGHGGNGSKAIFLNSWLEEHGLLRFKTNANGRILPSLVDAAKNIGIKAVPSSLKKMIFRKTQLANKIESSVRFARIDWRHSQSYSEETPYYPSIWINMRGREPDGIVMPGKEYEEIRDEIIDALGKWSDPETGQRLVSRVHKREAVYCGPCVGELPDLILEWNLDQGYSYLFKHSPGDKRRRTAIRRLRRPELNSAKSGDHRDDGIFVMTGKDIQPRRELQGARVVDLAPTILHLLGVPVPTDMDGEVLTEIFDVKYLKQHPVCYDHEESCTPHLSAEPQQHYSIDEEDAIRERLQGLGYIE